MISVTMTLKFKMIFADCAVFLFAVFGLIDGESQCPTDALKVCTCSTTSLSSSIKCRSDKFDEILDDIDLLSRHNMKVYKFGITSNSVQYLKPMLFQSIYVKIIELWLSNVSSIHKDVFKGQEDSLRQVRLGELRVKRNPINILRHCKKLRHLSFVKLSITKIGGKDFEQLDHPETIELVDYQMMAAMVTIEKGAFTPLTNLYSLMLPDMKLSSLTDDCLPRNTIGNVALMDNEFTSLPNEAIDALTKYGTLYMRGNEISTITNGQLHTMCEKGIKLTVTDNPVDCGCHFKKYFQKDRIIETKKYLVGKCSGPASRSEIKFADLKLSDFDSDC